MKDKTIEIKMVVMRLQSTIRYLEDMPTEQVQLTPDKYVKKISESAQNMLLISELVNKMEYEWGKEMRYEYQIIENGIVVGRFELSHYRDEAFERYFLNSNRSGFKRDISIGI